MSLHCPTQTMVFQKTLNEHSTDDVLLSNSLFKYLPVMPGVDCLAEQIEEGSFYEIDRTKLPPGTPCLLMQSIRVVMVTVKTDQDVTIRYPSTKSLQAYFVGCDEKWYPEWDEKFIMGSQLAAEVLARRIPSHEFNANRSLEAFWVAESTKTKTVPVPPLRTCNSAGNVRSKAGESLLSMLKTSSNIKPWGERRLVGYISNSEKNHTDQQSSNSASHIEVKAEMHEEGCVGVYESEGQRRKSFVSDGHAEEEIKVEHNDEVSTKIRVPRKRKRSGFAKSRNVEALVYKKKNSQTKATQKLFGDNFRWSAQRYENAKNELLAVMKAKQASYWNPISRHTLRFEARKHIGDTGLLDHLLKHVVDTLAPGGTERFKRRWDSQGVMEYWLESADLDDIRKKAGVQDPNWTPPPGWNPGDPICNHGSDCSSVINALKEELAKLRGKMQEDIANISVLNCTDTVDTVIGLSPAKFKERYEDLVKEKVRREKELSEILKSLKKMEQLIMKDESNDLDE